MRSVRANRTMIAAGIATILAIAVAATWVLLSDPDERPELVVEVLPDAAPEDADYPAPADEPNIGGFDQQLREQLQSARSDAERLKILDDVADNPDARSDSRALRSLMLAGRSADVRAKAFEVARTLAENEDRHSQVDVLRDGVENPYPEVRRASLRACRDDPQYELLEELKSVVRQGGSDRSLAIQALAFMDDPEAQKEVLKTARSESVSRPERIQAIALLARTDLREGSTYLQELATGEDRELQQVALEALKAWQDRKANR